MVPVQQRADSATAARLPCAPCLSSRSCRFSRCPHSLARPSRHPRPAPASRALIPLPADEYLDKVHGAWQAIMVANHTGLAHEGVYLDEASTADTIDLLLLDEWSTDDDTAVEWVDLHILEIYGLEPTYAQIRDEWITHLNNDF